MEVGEQTTHENGGKWQKSMGGEGAFERDNRQVPCGPSVDVCVLAAPWTVSAPATGSIQGVGMEIARLQAGVVWSERSA